MDLIAWIEKNLKPKDCNSEAFFYDEMESQSGFCLPVIYQPFDAKTGWHWGERGSIYDFLYAVEGEGKKLLDFGPGDGWPSLLVAPFAREVVGVDGSRKRVDVCTQNAARLGIRNARFVHYEPGSRLPFPDESFDGVMAASSIEQTPDPRATLNELFRVLRPGGRLRISYEGLNRYQGEQENTADLDAAGEQSTWLTLYARDLAREQAQMAKVKFAMAEQDVLRAFSPGKEGIEKSIEPARLEELREQIVEARTCRLHHPSGKTYCQWLKEIGFSEAIATHSGAWFARMLYDQTAEEARPGSLEEVDALLRPLVKIVVQMRAPFDMSGYAADPPITAIK
jgi:ubiquinone/menaquinone biosynthesis C-methylase UbiE